MLNRKYIGRLAWDQEPAEVDRAILRNDGLELVIECTIHGDRFTATLNRKNVSEEFVGQFETRQGGELSTGRALCELCKSSKGYVLMGTWIEDSISYFWSGVIEEVHSFQDET